MKKEEFVELYQFFLSVSDNNHHNAMDLLHTYFSQPKE